ncbi:MAG: tetratricopeptide repeat protein [Myxococcales bacterium]|nr:tetratricopeptide repeat protein [Myxococcales bacterium]
MAACPKCTRPVPDGRPACMYCGTRLSALVPCRQCGRPLQPGAPRCALCGTQQRATSEFRRPTASEIAIARVELFHNAEKAREKGHFRDAAQMLEEVVTVDPHHGRAWLALARTYASAAQPSLGVQALARCLSVMPDFDEARALKATLEASAARRTGSMPAARPSLTSVPDASPDEMLRRASTFIEKGRHAEALAIFDVFLTQTSGLSSHPSAAPLHVSRGVCLKVLGRLEDALAAQDAALRCDDKYALAWANRGDVLDDLGRAGEALAAFDKAVELDAANAKTWVDRGTVLRKLGRAEEALASYDRALAIDARDSLAWNNKGNALLGLQRYPDAAYAYDRALAVDPRNTNARNSLEWMKGKGLLTGAKPAAIGNDPSPARLDYTTFAESFAAGFGAQTHVHLDFSPASVMALDLLLDLSVPVPVGAGDEWAPDEPTRNLIVGVGAYLGEVFRRVTGGTWVDRCNDNPAPYSTGVVAPGNESVLVLPFMRAFKRIKYGDERLSAYLDDLRRQVKSEPEVTEAQAWAEQGARVAENRLFDEAIEFFDRALELMPRQPLALLMKGRTQLALGHDGRPALQAFLSHAPATMAAEIELARAAADGYKGGPKPPAGRAVAPGAMLGGSGAADLFPITVVASMIPEGRLLVAGWYLDVPLAFARKWGVATHAQKALSVSGLTHSGDAYVGRFEADATVMGDAHLGADDVRLWASLLESGRIASLTFVGNRPWSEAVEARVRETNRALDSRAVPLAGRITLRTLEVA